MGSKLPEVDLAGTHIDDGLGFWGEANFAVEAAHPRFAEAVEAAAAAGDEQQALEAARRILEGPEAAEVFGLTP